ncbi:hypothetical protein [Paenibacillus dakarensis]|uniref:hypothetical protein n=1 Tax=Paenibacillus dakarensis TaxID=1527293 RepID=UPI0006D5333A|nr:hypothetical protein [Paenibacillus dakarensis]
MKLYPEMFLSIWHLAVLIFVLIAFIAMVVGGYDKRTILRSTGGSLIIFYIIVTIPVALFTEQSLYQKDTMISGLDQRFEENKEMISSTSALESYIKVHIGAFQAKDEDRSKVLVYAGNYHESESYSGSLYVVLVDHDGNEVFAKTYEEITLKPGEKKEIESTFTTQPMDTFRYNFKAQSR